MNPALTMFGKTRMPLAFAARVLAAGVELYRARSAAWTSESTPSGAAAPAKQGPVEAMAPIVRISAVVTMRRCLGMFLSPHVGIPFPFGFASGSERCSSDGRASEPGADEIRGTGRPDVVERLRPELDGYRHAHAAPTRYGFLRAA